jgi:hypothetical protein
MATLIGLCCIRVVDSFAAETFKVDIRITPGTHTSGIMDVNKLNDKGASYCGVDTHLLSRP